MANRPLTLTDRSSAASHARVALRETLPPPAAPDAAPHKRPADAVFDAVLLLGPESHARLGGMSLLERAAFTLVRAGAQRLLFVGEPPAHPLRLPPVPVTWTPGDRDDIARWSQRGAGTLVTLAAETVVDAETVAAFAAAPSERILRTAAPVALWRCAPDLLPQVIEVAARQPTRAGEPAPPPGTRRWVPPARGLLLPASDVADRAAAERALYMRLGRAGDGWLTRLVDRRISRVLTRLLLPTGVSPNQITVMSVALGISAGLLFSMTSPRAAIAGSLLFLLSTIIDGCDGEIARLTFRESKLGRYLDIVGDNVVHVFLFAGIAVGLNRRAANEYTVVLGVLLVVGALLAMGIVYWLFVRREPAPPQRTFFEAFASREFAYVLVVLTVVGRLEWFLWAAAVGTYAFSFGLLALGGRRRVSAATRRQYTLP